MDYLQLCQRFVREIGIAGGGSDNPPAVTGQTGELNNVIEWIADAEEQINNQTLDWKYLWAEYSQALSISVQDPPNPSSPRARAWLKDSFWLDRFGTNQKRLTFKPWSDFRQLSAVPSQPLRITTRPNGNLRLDAPMTKALTLTAEYYKAPTRLANNTDTPAMPAEYHRIIICRAAVIYGGREDAPEVVHQYETEYIEILDKLERDQKPQREAEGEPDAYENIEQCIPGFELEGDLYSSDYGR